MSKQFLILGFAIGNGGSWTLIASLMPIGRVIWT
jgi:hypothetical protein